ncbi:MAG: sensor histidine kinase, partial [Chloroflexota bacterium]
GKPCYDEPMREIEPGLLQIFQLFGSIQWLLMLLLYTSAGDSSTTAQAVFGLTHATLLLIYLFWWQLRQWFGRLYLPVALVYSAAGISFGYAIGAGSSASEPGGLILWLIIPLIIVSAQYGWRAMLIFCVGTAALNIMLALVVMSMGGPNWDAMIEAELARITIFVIIGYIISRLIAGQRKQKHKLAEANARLARHAATLEQLAVSRERNRMARDLHDTLAHTLSSVALQLEAAQAIWEADPARAKETIRLTHRATRDGLQETRRALQALRTSPLDDLGFLLALQNLAHLAVERTGARLNLTMPEYIAEYPAEVEQAYYRIAEEALNNSVLHANASAFLVKLEEDSDCLALTLADNGTGFDVNAPVPDGHYGLVGMRERAALCGATLHMESTPGRGTIIQVIRRRPQ